MTTEHDEDATPFPSHPEMLADLVGNHEVAAHLPNEILVVGAGDHVHELLARLSSGMNGAGREMVILPVADRHHEQRTEDSDGSTPEQPRVVFIEARHSLSRLTHVLGRIAQKEEVVLVDCEEPVFHRERDLIIVRDDIPDPAPLDRLEFDDRRSGFRGKGADWRKSMKRGR